MRLLDPPSTTLSRANFANIINHSLRSEFARIHEFDSSIVDFARLSSVPGDFMMKTLLILATYAFHIVAIILV